VKVNPRNNVYLRTLSDGGVPKKDMVVPKTTSVGDSISISDTARLIKEAIGIGEPFSAEKVSAIRRSMQEGGYSVDINRLAHSMVRSLGEHARGQL